MPNEIETMSIPKEVTVLVLPMKENRLSLDDNEKGVLLDGLEHYLSIEKQNEDSGKTNLLRGVFDKYSSEKDFVLNISEQQTIFDGLSPYLKEKTKTEVCSPFLSVEAKKKLKENNKFLRNVFEKIIPNIETSMPSEEFLLMGIIVDQTINKTIEINLKRLEELGVNQDQYKSYEKYFANKNEQRIDFW